MEGLLMVLAVATLMGCCSTEASEPRDQSPPKLLDVIECVEPNICNSSAMAVLPVQSATVRVRYEGSSPFSVDWYLNGREFICEEHPSCYSGNSSGESFITLEYLPPLHFGVFGRFEANVSNPFGWNVSSTLLSQLCPPAPYPPIPLTHNETKTLTVNQNAILSCGIIISSAASLAACYVPPNKTLSNINQRENCVFCYSFTQGYCGTPVAKPTWTVSKSYTNANQCFKNWKTTVHVGSVTEEDFGELYCFWADSLEAHTYTVYELQVNGDTGYTVVSPSVPFIVIGSIFGGILLLILLPLAIAAFFSKKHRKMMMNTVNYEKGYEESPACTYPQKPTDSSEKSPPTDIHDKC